MTQEQKDSLMSADVKLNGRPAVVRGRLESFATIGQLDSLIAGQWSWESVQNIIDNHNGNFTL